ncbi:Sodium/calcium exchanger protein-domain-containing protein [Leucosporidium creatinivorum]|uniref:Sodium/calcium exchanger protein-domain-containing protein n=1 Tax=Leucosporidium creatinivorum TaxID=106004 RepID=A0A1Y2DWP2_9BASI|nr:Sodium/calcium exchanger protein-domain-containing protein [Leucosporidium creatinivorum]
MVENSSSSTSIPSHQTGTLTAPSAVTSDAELEPAIGGYSHNPTSHQLSPHQEYDDEKNDSRDQDDLPASANALHRLRGRLTEGAPGGSQLRSASAPNLGREEAVPDTQVIGIIKRSNTQINATTPSTRPPLISKKLLEPSVPVGKPPGWKSSLLATARYSWLNVLLIAVPIAWAMDFSHQGPTTIFVTSFIAIVPLAALLGFATEELALRVGDAFGGLLNATFGNAVELIISILALVKGELRIVQSSMLGSILSNCLLVLGMCYFVGGLRFHEQGYGIRAAQANGNLLGLAVAAIIIPVAYHMFVTDLGTQSLATTDADILGLSHGIAIILLVVYAAYLTFQLWTHAYLYLPPRLEEGQQPQTILPFIEGPQPPTEGGVFRIPSLPSWGSSSTSSRSTRANSVASGMEEGDVESQTEKKDKDHDHNTPKLSVWFSLALLVVVTVLTGVTAEFLIDSIDGLTQTTPISREFVALILLPLVGNAAEHVTAVVVARKNKLDLSMAVAVGSSIQIALFVVPLLICLGWIIGQPLTLFFDPFEVLVLFVSIVAVNWAIADGRTNWLEGFTLMVMYIIIAVVFL